MTALPQNCPTWCSSGPDGHKQALDEGCPPADARVHMGGDLAGGTEVSGQRFSWSVWLRSDPGEDCVYWGEPFIEVEAHRHGEDAYAWQLDSSAARTLARQLLHFADAVDLHP